MTKLALILYLVPLYFQVQSTLSIWVDKEGGYRDLLIAVDKPKGLTECGDILRKIKDLTTFFSKNLWHSTHGRLHFNSVDVILDVDLAKYCDVTTIGTNQKWTNADIRLLDTGIPSKTISESSNFDQLIRVQQPEGCAEPGDVIEIDMNLLDQFGEGGMNHGSSEGGMNHGPSEADKRARLGDKDENAITKIGQDLVTSWAQYRWGVFGGLNPNWSNKSNSVEEVKDLSRNWTSNCVNETRNCSSEKITNFATSKSQTYSKAEPDEDLDNRQHLVCEKSVWEIIENHRDFSGTVPLSNSGVSGISRDEKNTVTETMIPKVTGTTTHATSTSTSIPLIKTTENVQPFVSTKSKVLEARTFDNVKKTSNPKGNSRIVRSARTEEDVEDSHPPSETSSFIGVLPPVEGTKNEHSDMTNDDVSIEPFLGSLFGRIYNQKIFSNSNLSNDKIKKFEPNSLNKTGKQIFTVNESSEPSASPVKVEVVANTPKQLSKDKSIKSSKIEISSPFHKFQEPKINFLSASKKTVIFALDLSSAAVTQTSVDWLRGGLLRWMFGIGSGVNIGIIASYSNTSFPLSFGPIAPGPSTSRQLEDHLTLLPYQHEVDDDVYGGPYCLGCVIKETEKMLTDAAIPLESAILILGVCEPVIPENQLKIASNTRIPIHTVALCPNSPLSIERLATKQGSWALSQITMETGFASEVQLGKLATKITEESLLWPNNLRLQTIYEEEKLLRDEDVEKIGTYRRVRGSISLPEQNDAQRLIILVSSTPAKVVDIWIGNKKKEMIRDTTRRYWALLEGHETTISYSFKYLSTSLEIPLTVAIGIYERSGDKGLNIKLRTNMRFYEPMNPQSPYLKVWAIITKDGKRVSDADVTLSVTYLNGRTPSTYSLMMLDDGSTEPDMKSGDGIYSRYLTWTPGPGRYILTAKVTESGRSVIGITGKSLRHTVESSPISLILNSALPGDIFPPSRITSLDVSSIGNTLVNISWLAPGGDLDQGSAWRYQLKMYTGREALSKENFDATGIDVYCIHGQEERAPMPAPALFGTPQYCVTSIPFSNLNWYFAIRAVDGANNTGRISNIVSTFVYEPTTTLRAKEAKFNDGVQKVMMSTVIPANNKLSDKSSSWRLYGAALIGAVSFIMFVISVFACVICCRRARLRKSKDPERPIYKIYVNNAYIQEEDGEIKVVSKEKSITEKDPTQQWVNSLDKYSSVDAPKEEVVESSGDALEQHSPSSKYPKPVRFGVLTNGSIMRELPICSSNPSSKPDDPIPDDFKYKDLSETISNSTSDGATGSTSSGATESTTLDQVTSKEAQRATVLPPLLGYDISYPPLGIPTLHSPTIIPVHSSRNDYHSDDEGGFRPRTSYDDKTQPPPKFSSFRYLSPQEINSVPPPRPMDYSPTYGISKNQNAALPHGTVRSVKKRRHISFV